MPPNCSHLLDIGLLQHRDMENGICSCSLSDKTSKNTCSIPRDLGEMWTATWLPSSLKQFFQKAELWEDGYNPWLEYHGFLLFLLRVHTFCRIKVSQFVVNPSISRDFEQLTLLILTSLIRVFVGEWLPWTPQTTILGVLPGVLCHAAVTS